VENLANAVGAITNAVGPEANRIALAAQDEGKEILARAGIRWVPAKEAAHRPPTTLRRRLIIILAGR